MPVSTSSGPGVKSYMDVNSSPVIPMSSTTNQPHTWSWIWFGLAVLVIAGFHVRVFGHPVPPAAAFP